MKEMKGMNYDGKKDQYGMLGKPVGMPTKGAVNWSGVADYKPQARIRDGKTYGAEYKKGY